MSASSLSLSPPHALGCTRSWRAERAPLTQRALRRAGRPVVLGALPGRCSVAASSSAAAAVATPRPALPSLSKTAQLALQLLAGGCDSRASPSTNPMHESQAGPSGLALAGLAPFLVLGPALHDLLHNPTFCATGLAWVLAQTLKVFTKYVKTRTWDVRVLFDSGGMPSSHTSLVVGLATSVGVQLGLGSSLFVVCLAFALIVMYDAAGVRRHAGKQAEVLNALVEDYFQGHPVAEQELKEVLGHTPMQVAMGALLGIVTALVYHRYC